MRRAKYIMYDDMRMVGTYKTLAEAYDTGLIKQTRQYFYKRYAVDKCYIYKNICVYSLRNQSARCLFLGNIINRFAALSSNTFKLNDVLTKAAKEITGHEL